MTRPAPSLHRSLVTVKETARRFGRPESDHILVTNSDGRLVGCVCRSDAERRATGSTPDGRAASG
jgi:hypothetical protein